MTEDSELLRRYAEENSEEAFAELVRRHLNLVYSAALRQVNGDNHLARDVAQTVFSDLARKAPTLLRRSVLTGWLYTSTHFAATKAVRAECRRRAHEQEATVMNELLKPAESELDWDRVGPVLDEVMHQLNDSDRDLVLLRYFENRRLEEIGASLGLTDDAARKRLERALNKLRGFLVKRGLTTTTLAATLSTNAVQAAPAGLVASLTSVSLVGASVAGGIGFSVFKPMAITKLQISFVSAVAIIGVTVPLLVQHQRQTSLQGENESLVRAAAQLRTQNEALTNQIANADHAESFSKDQLSELLRLRAEAGRLRRQVTDLERFRVENPRAQQPAVGNNAAPRPTSAQPPFQVRLVVGDQDENAEIITNRTKGVDGYTDAEPLYVQKAPLMDATAIQSADVVTDATTGSPQIEVILTDQGRQLFAKATKENLNRRLAIVLDGQSYFAPKVRDEITGGRIQLTGAFTDEQARELVDKINEAISRQ